MLWENEPQHKMGMPPSGHLATVMHRTYNNRLFVRHFTVHETCSPHLTQLYVLGCSCATPGDHINGDQPPQSNP